MATSNTDPEIAEASLKFDRNFRRALGMYLPISRKGHVKEVLRNNWPVKDVRFAAQAVSAGSPLPTRGRGFAPPRRPVSARPLSARLPYPRGVVPAFAVACFR